MTEIAFYHLEQWPLERALPMLLEKTLAAGKRALVLAASEARIESLNGALWTYDAASWLPHGSSRDGDDEEQPVWLAVDGDNANSADYLFLTDGATHSALDGFERCFVLFDGNDSSALEAARAQWRELKDTSHELAYWRQGAGGGWEKAH